MANKNKKRETQNDADALGMSSTEKILRRIHELYEKGLCADDAEGGTIGLLEIAHDPLLNVQGVWKPRKKVNVMIVGNHSAGKSSFINWYVGESVQTTGVAIETRGFTYVTSGRKRETLKGDATFAFYDHIGGLREFKGVEENVFTEISTSKDRNFACVDFVDTPGLVDGEMEYPFDVVESIAWLADHVDLILCFFDPIGQALCKRTMTAVERLNEKHAEKLAYYMSKADQVEKEHDRQRVLIQITQNLAGRIKNSHAFKLPTIYLPRDDLAVPIPNAIEEVCEDVDKAIRLTVQKNLTTMKDDCAKIVKAIDARGEEDARRKKDNAARTIKGWAFMFAGWLVLSLLAYVATLETFALRPVAVAMRVHALPRLSEDEFPVARAVMTGLLPTEVAEGEVAAKRWMGVENGGLYAMAWLSVAYVTLQVMKRKAWRGREARLTKREWKKLEGYRAYAIEVSAVREELYKEYFKQLHEGDGY
ncbi:uncharacterized protein MICPUCDRAFT_47608 [Micromonas pusilla CCMP1545]|uniref:Predicted protein n=1 Tax=Micromonas pusilla (strain CCMP1545) TaxID=564608 RepID=C1MV99_MICPC|nr:uncharacterized protein MICPUCDRAFT_47608 [Micromonas pusilla CCMP1545]EEH56763.1 predicted protein [Micromonas pusilla CCMP1545]|eukprot:XP_003059631.1 predicted protein [Micromonas pusilla CCMP1545]